MKTVVSQKIRIRRGTPLSIRDSATRGVNRVMASFLVAKSPSTLEGYYSIMALAISQTCKAVTKYFKENKAEYCYVQLVVYDDFRFPSVKVIESLHDGIDVSIKIELVKMIY